MNKKRLISCCIAALTFAACEDRIEPRPAPVKRAAIVTAPAPAPVAAVVVDAGAAIEAEPVDVLALKHDQPQVDHLERARLLLDDGNAAGAFTESRRALFTNPTDEDALAFTARTAQKLGRHALAAEAFARIGALRPDDAVPCVAQARALVKAREFAEAVAAARQAIARDATNPEGYQAAGLGHLGNGELAGAIAMFSQVIELKPDHGHALNNLGLAYLRASQNTRAVEALERAVELLPTTAWVHNNLGVALERVGRHDEAKQAYLTATTLSPKYVKARVNANRVAKAPAPNDVATEPDDYFDVSPDTHPEN